MRTTVCESEGWIKVGMEVEVYLRSGTRVRGCVTTLTNVSFRVKSSEPLWFRNRRSGYTQCSFSFEGSNRDCIVEFLGKEAAIPANFNGGGTVMMKKVIVENFERTEDAVLVDKWFNALGLRDNFSGSLEVKQNKEAILNEAKRLEAVDVKKAIPYPQE